jgi:NAD(P)-dependent dehydrogenase (short-subunit alcohol dehydrogenase family)
MRFTGKKAVVVGAKEESIGQAIARALIAEGAQVCVWDIDIDSAKKAVGQKAKFKKVNALDFDACQRAAAETIKEMGGVDFLVPTVGGGHFKMTGDYTAEFFKKELDYNAVTLLNCALPFLKLFLEKGEGKMLFFTSATGGTPGLLGYEAGKAVVESLMKGFICETQGKKININCLLPGIVPTTLTKGYFESTGANGDEMLKAIAAGTVYGLTSQDEVAKTVLWLLSKEAERLNGQVFAML